MKDSIGGFCGVMLSTVGTMMQTNISYEIVSLVVTILGLIVTIITTIILPLIRWYKKSKEDGKITMDEISEGIDIINKGIDDLKGGDKNG